MKKSIYLIIALAVATILITGCFEEQNVKKERIATYNENTQLKEQLAQCDIQIQQLGQQVLTLLEEKKQLQEQFETSIKGLGDAALKDFEENVRLKTQIAELEKQLQELKAPKSQQ